MHSPFVLGRLAGHPKSYPWKPSVPRACPNPPSLLAPRPGGACAGGGGALYQGAQALYQAHCITKVLKGRFTKGLVEECIPGALKKSLEACIPPPFTQEPEFIPCSYGPEFGEREWGIPSPWSESRLHLYPYWKGEPWLQKLAVCLFRFMYRGVKTPLSPLLARLPVSCSGGE